MGLLLDQDPAKAALEEVTSPFVPPIEPLRKAGIQVVQAFREPPLRRFDQQVVMVAHQTESMNVPVRLFADQAEQMQPSAAVRVVAKHAAAFVPPRHDVVDSAREIEAKRSRHLAA